MALTSGLRAQYPPIITPYFLAALVGRSLEAIRHWSAHDQLRGACRRRGKHLLVWRDRAWARSLDQPINHGRGVGISLLIDEIDAAFADGPWNERFPPQLSPEALAALVHVGRSTIYRWTALGLLEGTFVLRSTRIRFVRHAVISMLFNGPDWPKGQYP